jgi:5-methylcytosine-specific restriction endonuclease McrA
VWVEEEMRVCPYCHKEFDEPHQFKICDACRMRCRENEVKRRARAKANFGNICPQCLKPLESTQYKLCAACRAYQRSRADYKVKWAQKNRQKRIAAGLCAHCGEPNDSEGFKHCSKCREDVREWFDNHPDYASVYMATWREDNQEMRREYQKGWYDGNYERYKVYNQNRKARKLGNGGELPQGIETVLFEQQEGLCYLCGELLYRGFNDPLSIDHLVPISRGGRNDTSNVKLAHLSCNMKKSIRTHDEYLEHLSKL